MQANSKTTLDQQQPMQLKHCSYVYHSNELDRLWPSQTCLDLFPQNPSKSVKMDRSRRCALLQSICRLFRDTFRLFFHLANSCRFASVIALDRMVVEYSSKPFALHDFFQRFHIVFISRSSIEIVVSVNDSNSLSNLARFRNPITS